MDEAAKKWIKDNGFFIKNVSFIDNEPILSKEQYEDEYESSGGSISGDGFCLFYSKKEGMTNYKKGNLHIMSKEIEDEIFKVDNMPIVDNNRSK